MNKHIYYIYFYKHPETLDLMYIGKGKDNRLNDHWRRRKHHYNKRFKDFLLQLESDGLEPLIEIHQSGLTNSESFLLEFELIRKHGRLNYDEGGILLNMTNGLDGIKLCNLENASLEDIRKYLDTAVHHNYRVIEESEKDEIVEMYNDNVPMVSIAKILSRGPHKIKEVLKERDVAIKKRGGQSGESNGMYGVKRPYNAHFGGRKHSEESKAKIAIAAQRTAKVELDGIEFNSLKEASEYLDMPYSSLSTYLRKGGKFTRNKIEHNIKRNF